MLGQPADHVEALRVRAQVHESPPRYYAGVTSDVARRHAEHNAGNCTHTAKCRPWSVDVVIEFADERRAVAFERYLKSGSGVSFDSYVGGVYRVLASSASCEHVAKHLAGTRTRPPWLSRSHRGPQHGGSEEAL